nr:hypothetical protein [Tanacetum cinerariifolium]
MSRKDNLPRRAFSLRYLATHEFDVSLKSATAFAMLGSVLSMFIVVLTFWITSCVSFAYSSSVAANAGDGVARSGMDKVVMAVSDKKLRRFEVIAAVVEGVVAEWLQRMSRRGFGVEVVGVIRVGDAMVVSDGVKYFHPRHLIMIVLSAHNPRLEHQRIKLCDISVHRSLLSRQHVLGSRPPRLIRLMVGRIVGWIVVGKNQVGLVVDENWVIVEIARGEHRSKTGPDRPRPDRTETELVQNSGPRTGPKWYGPVRVGLRLVTTVREAIPPVIVSLAREKARLVAWHELHQPDGLNRFFTIGIKSHEPVISRIRTRNDDPDVVNMVTNRFVEKQVAIADGCEIVFMSETLIF